MKATGIVRRIDDLGRVVIPKEIRRTLRIKEGTPLEIFTDREGEIILKKYSPIGELSLFAKEYAESLSHSTGMLSCITDHDQVVAAAGPGSKEFIGKLISSQLEAVINDREAKCLSARDRGKVPVVDEQPAPSTSQVIQPIIAAGDAIGSVILMGKTDKDIPGLYAVGLDGAMLWRNVYTQNMPGTAMANNINSGRNAANAAAKYIA